MRGKIVFRTIMTGLLVALSFGVVGHGVAYAEDPDVGITISPTDKHYTANPGDTITDTFTILNDGKTAYDFTVYASPYSVTDRTYDPNYNDVTPRGDVNKWAALPQTKWHATARQTLTIPFTIKVSSTASPGGHYGVLFAETEPTGGGTISRKDKVGMIVYVTVNGEVQRGGSVKNINVSAYQPYSPITATTAVQNTGNTDFPVQTTMAVADIFGNVKYSRQDERYVLPGTTRDASFSWDQSPWFGVFNVKMSVTILGKTTHKDQLIVVAPYWLFIVFGLGIMLLAIDFLRRKRKKVKSRHDAKVGR